MRNAIRKTISHRNLSVHQIWCLWNSSSMRKISFALVVFTVLTLFFRHFIRPLAFIRSLCFCFCFFYFTSFTFDFTIVSFQHLLLCVDTKRRRHWHRRVAKDVSIRIENGKYMQMKQTSRFLCVRFYFSQYSESHLRWNWDHSGSCWLSYLFGHFHNSAMATVRRRCEMKKKRNCGEMRKWENHERASIFLLLFGVFALFLRRCRRHCHRRRFIFFPFSLYFISFDVFIKVLDWNCIVAVVQCGLQFSLFYIFTQEFTSSPTVLCTRTHRSIGLLWKAKEEEKTKRKCVAHCHCQW